MDLPKFLKGCSKSGKRPDGRMEATPTNTIFRETDVNNLVLEIVTGFMTNRNLTCWGDVTDPMRVEMMREFAGHIWLNTELYSWRQAYHCFSNKASDGTRSRKCRAKEQNIILPWVDAKKIKEQWEDPNFQKTCAKNKENKEKGSGSSKHTAGSRTFAALGHGISNYLGGAPVPIDVLHRMSHTQWKDEQNSSAPKWVSEVAKMDNDGYQIEKEEYLQQNRISGSESSNAGNLPQEVEDKIWAGRNKSNHGRVRGFTHRIKAGKSRNTVNHGGPFCCAGQPSPGMMMVPEDQFNDLLAAMNIMIQNNQTGQPINMPGDLMERMAKYGQASNTPRGLNSVNFSGMEEDGEEEEEEEEDGDDDDGSGM